MNAETGRKFHFIRVIASGGFGSVYLAKEQHSDGFSRVVAVKLLHPKWSENEEVASRMRDEARLLGQIRHRHIVDVRDLTRIDGRVAVVMEYLEAVDLKDIVHGCIEDGTTVPVRAALEIGADVSSALDAAYNRPPYAGEKPLRVIHRDIKPSNVMVDDQGNAKVLDFGVARADFQGRESETQELSFGSVEYMPPERLFFEPESPASDVYSLGATLYELLARSKFGKAKLRPALHDQHVDARLDVIFAAHPEGTESVRDEVDLLLTEMLSFDEADRPTAADCALRMRELAGQLQSEPNLTTWSRGFIPPLVEQAHALSESIVVEDALVNRIMEEDSKGFVRLPGSPSDTPAEPALMSAADIAFDELKEQALAARTQPPANERAAAPPVPPRVLQRTVPPMVASPVPPQRVEVPDTQVVQNPLGLGVPPPPPRRSTVSPGAPSRSAPTPETDVARVRGPRTSDDDFRVDSVRQRPASTAVMAPPPRRDRDDEPIDEPPRSGRRFKTAAAALATVAIVSALVVVVGVVLAVVVGPSMTSGSGTPAVADRSQLIEAVAVTPAIAEGPQATFTSELPGTRKLTVRCEEGSGEGETIASVAGESLGDCTVTAMDASRRRLTAVVQQARAADYSCFVDGEPECDIR